MIGLVWDIEIVSHIVLCPFSWSGVGGGRGVDNEQLIVGCDYHTHIGALNRGYEWRRPKLHPHIEA